MSDNPYRQSGHVANPYNFARELREKQEAVQTAVSAESATYTRDTVWPAMKRELLTWVEKNNLRGPRCLVYELVERTMTNVPQPEKPVSVDYDVLKALAEADGFLYDDDKRYPSLVWTR